MKKLTAFAFLSALVLTALTLSLYARRSVRFDAAAPLQETSELTEPESELDAGSDSQLEFPVPSIPEPEALEAPIPEPDFFEEHVLEPEALEEHVPEPEALEEHVPEPDFFEEHVPEALPETASVLSPAEAVVYNYQELKTALENNNGITTVYFGADIDIQIGGVNISPSKTHLVISGINPLEPGQVTPYTLTDYSSSSFYSTLYIDETGISSLAVRDLNITGRNFYGPVSILDSASLSGITLIYERVNYNGPQLCYHRRGTVRIRDCTVSIHGGNGGSLNQEFSEAKHLVFEGKNVINTVTSTNTIFWHPAGGSFSLADDSRVTIDSPNTSSLYGVFYADLPTYNVDLKVGERAVLDMTIAGSVAPEAFVTLSGLTVREGGAFRLRTTKAADATVLRVAGTLTVEKESAFIISGYGGASYSLLRLETGNITLDNNSVFRLTSDNPYSSLLNLAGRNFLCSDPASVLMYNAGRCIQASSSTAQISISAQQLNYWDTLSADNPDAVPQNKWDKPDGTDFVFSGALSTAGEWLNTSSNYSPGDPPGTPPDSSTFSMSKARVLSFGRLELSLAAPTANTTVISGVTKPGATVRAAFTQKGTDYVFPVTTADSAGIFHIPIDVTLINGTIVTVRSAKDYLSTTKMAAVSGGGTLDFSVPAAMEFFVSEISPKTSTIKRLHPGWELVIIDERGAGKKWSVYARLDSELTPDKPNLPPLTGALVFAGGQGGETILHPGSDVFIADHTSDFDEEITPITWDEDKGILLKVRPGTAFTDTVYTAEISWTLVDAP